jgi:MFS family permease
MNVFMNEMHIPNAAAKMTLSQVSDVVFLLLLPAFLSRIGSKGILLLGMSAWAVRFVLFAVFHQNPTLLWMLFTGILLHGMCYDFIFVMGRMLVDKYAGEDIRGAAQGLHAIITLGAGMFVGSWLSGVVAQHYTEAGGHAWQTIWLIPAIIGAVLSVVFAVLYSEPKHAEDTRR